jgi:hypothetical protein
MGPVAVEYVLVGPFTGESQDHIPVNEVTAAPGG